MSPRVTPLERLLKYFPEPRPDGCWEWTGARSPKGYGKFNYKGKDRFAHRVAYELLVGEVPSDKRVCHRCDNPPCIRPDHLFLGTVQENTQDMVDKGRHPKPHAKKTHCPAGHPYDSDNTYTGGSRPWATRKCRECHRLQAARRRAKARAA